MEGLALPVDGDLDQLRKRAARTLGVRPGALGELDIVRQSIDARRKDDVHYVYTVELSMANEASMVRFRPRSKHLSDGAETLRLPRCGTEGGPCLR